MKKIILSLFGVLFFNFAYCQVNRDMPDWVKNPDAYIVDGNNSKMFQMKIFGETRKDVEKEFAQRMEEYGVYNIIGDPYWLNSDDNNWIYGYFLVQVCSKHKRCNNREHIKEHINLSTTKYPFSARCFVPGMAQIYKGSAGKGGAIIAAEIVGIAGIVTSFSMSASHFAAADSSSDSYQINEYNRIGSMWQNIGYGSIAFTAAMYIYNIIDGAVAPGKKHIQIGSKAYDLSFTPTATMQGDFGFAARLNF